MPLKFFRSFSDSYSGRSLDSGEQTIFSAGAFEIAIGTYFLWFSLLKSFTTSAGKDGVRTSTMQALKQTTFGKILTKLSVFVWNLLKTLACINLNFVSRHRLKNFAPTVSQANGVTRDSRGKLFFNFPSNQEEQKITSRLKSWLSMSSSENIPFNLCCPTRSQPKTIFPIPLSHSLTTNIWDRKLLMVSHSFIADNVVCLRFLTLALRRPPTYLIQIH